MTTNINDGFSQTTAVGGETTIDFDFSITAASDMLLLRTSALGVITTLVLGNDYTIADSELNNEAGGQIALTVAATASQKYSCISNIPETRSSDFQTGGDLLAATLNRQFDRLTRLAQQNRRDIGKAVTLAPDSSYASAVYIDDPEDGKVQYWDDAAGRFVNGPTASEIAASADSASDAAASAVAAAASAVSAEESAESLFGVSFSSVTIGSGLKSFTTDPNRIFLPGTWLIAVEAGGSAYVHGQVATYNSGTGDLGLNVTNTSGAGTFAAWVIIISGTQGPPGSASALEAGNITYDNGTSGLTATDVQNAIDEIAAGAASFTVNGATGITAAATDDYLVLSDTSDSNANKKILVSNFFKVINSFTEDTTPDPDADFLVTYDTSASAMKKALISSILTGLAGGIIDVQFFTASGTWTKPAGCNKALVFVTGGGGGGAGPSGARTYAGSAGGSSSFGSHCSATGGTGGLDDGGSDIPTVSALGGIGSSGDFNIRGGAGQGGAFCKNDNDENASRNGYVLLPGGMGGSSFFGGGGIGGDANNAGVAGGSGGSYGGGGGGGNNANSNAGNESRAAGGGAGGGTAIKWIDTGLGTTETVTIGAGGTRSTTPTALSRGGVGSAGACLVISFT